MYTYMDLCRVCMLFFVLWRWYHDRPAMKSICSVSICVSVCLSDSSRVSRLSTRAAVLLSRRGLWCSLLIGYGVHTAACCGSCAVCWTMIKTALHVCSCCARKVTVVLACLSGCPPPSTVVRQPAEDPTIATPVSWPAPSIAAFVLDRHTLVADELLLQAP